MYISQTKGHSNKHENILQLSSVVKLTYIDLSYTCISL